MFVSRGRGVPPLFDLLCPRESLKQGLRPPSWLLTLTCYLDALSVSKSMPNLACLGLGLWSGFCLSRCRGSHLLLLIHTVGRSCAHAGGFGMLSVCALGHFSVAGMFRACLCWVFVSIAGRRLLMYGAVVVPSVFPLVLLLALGLAHVAVRPFACACTYACLCVLFCLLVEWDVLLSGGPRRSLGEWVTSALPHPAHSHTCFWAPVKRFPPPFSASPAAWVFGRPAILNSWFPLFARLGLFALVALLG